MSFLDDVLRMCEDVDSAQYANDKMETMLGKKSLELNLEKSSFLVIGNKKARKNITAQLKKSPLKLCGINMKEEKVIKYLGDSLMSTLEDSVHKTVSSRIGVARHAIYEIRAIVEDSRASSVGGINLAYTIWDQAILGSLLLNSETWEVLPKKTMKLLKDTTNLFHRSILRVGTGMPIVSLYWLSGSLQIEYSILLRQLNFVHHLANLPPDSLGREVLELQKLHRLPSLALHLEAHLDAIGVSDLMQVSKWQWQRLTKKYVLKLNQESLLEEAKKYKKVSYDEMAKETFGRKPYFYTMSLEDVRYRTRIHSKMIDVRGNFSRKYKRKGLTCPSCKGERKIALNHHQ